MITDRINALIADFKRFNDWEERYKHLINLGKNMQDMEESNRIPANIVKGCKSQI